MSPSPLRALIEYLPEQHRRALAWFDDHAGQVVGWPGALDDGTLLATKAKGIYKPHWARHALSIRQSLHGPYPDRDVERRPDGSWTFAYFQEGLDPDRGSDSFTNPGLLECLRDVVPVGVFVQTQPKPLPRYHVLGLALVAGYDAGYFYLEGSDAGFAREPRISGANIAALTPAERADHIADVFGHGDIEGAQEKVLALINRRRGQAGFRRTLLDAYGRRCAVTGYDATDALEAAHIKPYRGPVTNHLSNGILLRADIHTLFDLRLLTIDHAGRRVLLDHELQNTKYAALVTCDVHFPADDRMQPSREALAWHRARLGA